MGAELLLEDFNLNLLVIRRTLHLAQPRHLDLLARPRLPNLVEADSEERGVQDEEFAEVFHAFVEGGVAGDGPDHYFERRTIIWRRDEAGPCACVTRILLFLPNLVLNAGPRYKIVDFSLESVHDLAEVFEVN